MTLVAGSLHNLALTCEGKVYSWGCNDEGALGREGQNKLPGLVPLEHPVDLIACGDSFSVAANSKSGLLYFWGSFRSE